MKIIQLGMSLTVLMMTMQIASASEFKSKIICRNRGQGLDSVIKLYFTNIERPTSPEWKRGEREVHGRYLIAFENGNVIKGGVSGIVTPRSWYGGVIDLNIEAADGVKQRLLIFRTATQPNDRYNGDFLDRELKCSGSWL